MRRQPTPKPWGSDTAPISTAASFALSQEPCGDAAAGAGASPPWRAGRLDADEFAHLRRAPSDTPDRGRPPAGCGCCRAAVLCSAIVSVARANDLPIPFFANLIWQESSFDPRPSARPARSAWRSSFRRRRSSTGLMNPFEPVHALFASGRLLRKLNEHFGNLGLAAAAYNAGPQRVMTGWPCAGACRPKPAPMCVRITGHQADQWLSSEFARGPEATLMPARAPCAEVAEAVKAQTQYRARRQADVGARGRHGRRRHRRINRVSRPLTEPSPPANRRAVEKKNAPAQNAGRCGANQAADGALR